MNAEQSKMSRIITELRNRRVFRVATVYLGTSFVLLEAADIILPRLGLPDWTITFVMTLMGIGFPIAVGLAWTFQFTPEGLRRSPSSGEKQTTKAKPFTGNGIIIALLTLILGVLIYPNIFYSSNSSDDGVFSSLDSKSVAVLPFTTFTKTDEDQSFADGVHDDILTQLSKIGELKVISRTSMMKYKETTKSIPEIAKELGVLNLLEGSVRRAGDQVRVVAQLINARTDEHLWAETYDRKYADIFALQSDVAKKIARALKAELTPQEVQYIETKPTDNQEAWELFTRAILLVGNNYVEGDTAITLFEEAVQLDPEFLHAIAKISRHHAHAYFDGGGRDPSPERLEKARTALDRAIELDPDAPETHIAHGYFHYYGSRDYQRALEEFYIAQTTQPNNSDLFAAIAYVERRLGQWDACWENLEKAVALDPNNPEKVYEIVLTARMMRKWAEAEKYQKRFSAIRGGNDIGVEVTEYWISLSQHGNLEKLQAIYDDLLSRFGDDEMSGMKQWHAFFSRKFAYGLEVNESQNEVQHWTRANWLRLNGRHDEARTHFDTALVEVEARIAENPEDWEGYADKGRLMARLGKHVEAISFGKRAVDMMPLSRDAILGAEALDDLMSTYLICGEDDLAIDIIEELLSIPSGMNIATLKLGPHFDPLRDNPRFHALIKETI